MPLPSPLHELWTELPGELLGLLLPAPCAGCPTGRGRLCPSCRAALAGARPGPTAVAGVHAAAPYADPVRRLLLAHKERGALHLAGPLGAALAGAVRSALGPGGPGAPLLLVPVPSTRASVRARGHDPTLRLARAAARSLRRSGLPASVAPVLRHTRRVADQSGLTAEARRRNLSGALAVPPRLGRRLARPSPDQASPDQTSPGQTSPDQALPRQAAPGQALPRQAAPWRLVLVDDLVTTGASLAEAARALAVAGAPPAAAATVAAAVLRRAPAPAARQPG
ncbi:ComF family protein [Kitasatospora sp. NPDC057223]|uniref:ComF family protein n=1 Tax=Kitasatospora sp. NPDC057223 TaxID=3346055 RepID=UPI0036352149